MVIIINKNGSVAQVTPSTVYQGSNLASELTVFAPFSVSSYPAILCNFLLPSGKYLPSLIAFYSANQPEGFGAWTTELPASVTALSGTVKVSFAFIGASHTIDESTTPPTISGSGPIMTTEAAEFTVQATVPTLPNLPDVDIYNQIIEALASILQRRPDWVQTTESAPDYIKNKPPIEPVKNGQGELTGARVDGNLEVTESLTVDGVGFEDKLDKATPADTLTTAVYATYRGLGDTAEQQIIEVAQTPRSDAIPRYDNAGRLTSNYPSSYSTDCVNVEYFKEKTATRLLYDGSTGVLSLADVNNNVIGSVDLPLEMTVSGAYYENGFLYLTFTNGETVPISLEDLLLPAWVSDLSNIPSGSGNVPPTADAVKTYVDTNAASAIRGNVSGGAILLDDISTLNNTVSISTSPSVSTVGIFGRNLILASQINKATPASLGTLTVSGNQIVLGANTIYGTRITLPNPIPAGTVISFSFDWDSNSSSENGFGRIYLQNSQDSTQKSFNTTSATTLLESDLKYIDIYKNSVTTPSTAPIYISNLCLNIGTEAIFTPFESMVNLQLTNGRGTYTAEGGRDITIIPPTESTVAAEYYKDSTKVINKLSRQIIALQNTIT